MPKAPEVHFYLKPKDGTGHHLIYLQFKYNGRRLFYSFGERVKFKQWNVNKERLKDSDTNETAAAVANKEQDAALTVNGLLEKLSKECVRFYNERKRANDLPTVEVFRQHLQNFLYPAQVVQVETKTLYNLIDRFASGEIKAKGNERAKKSTDSYKYFKLHLAKYQAARNVAAPLDYADITLDFFFKFTQFLKTDLGVKRNTIAKDISLLKAVMNTAVMLGETTNVAYKNTMFSYTEEPADSVYIDEKNLQKLAGHDFSSNKRLEQIRDLFVFGCCTGLRFSDYSTIKPENIIEIDGATYISRETIKTKERVMIACNSIVLNIFDRYAKNFNRLPKSLSNQKFNKFIKEVCQVAKLDEKGKMETAPDLSLYECVSSHTARRSFATNLYLEDYPVYDIMALTGHKTEKAFKKYIRITHLDKAKRHHAHIAKKEQAKVLRIAV